MTIAVTGHRPDKLGKEYALKGPYSDYITEKLQEIIEQFQPKKGISGMALGVDSIWAITCLFNRIPLVAAIPFKGQELSWPQKSQDMYRRILSHKLTNCHVVCEGDYAAWKLQKRNIWMVDNCNLLVAFHNGSPGGTANCIGYASAQKKKIIIFNPEDWRTLKRA